MELGYPGSRKVTLTFHGDQGQQDQRGWALEQEQLVRQRWVQGCARYPPRSLIKGLIDQTCLHVEILKPLGKVETHEINIS